MNGPVRVLCFDHTAELGGAEIALADLLRHLDRKRVEPTVVLGSAGPLLERISSDVPVHVLPMDPDIVRARKDSIGLASLWNVRSALRTMTYILQLRRLIRRMRPHLIHTNSLKSAVIGGIAARLAATPVLWHIRDRIAEDYLSPSAVRAIRLLARVIPQYVIANSAATLSSLQLHRVPSAVVPSGVDTSKFSASGNPGHPAAKHPGQQIIGLIGRICPWKGQHIFIEAAAAVHARYPQVRFRIIGSALFTDQPYERQIVTMIEECGLRDIIKLTGFRADVERAIQSLDIVAHASITGEPFGQVIVQAMASGKPVIATNGGGVPEIIVDRESGILVPMGDAQAMANAICSLIANPVAATALAQAGLKRVQERFTISVTVDKLTSVYEELAAKYPRRAAFMVKRLTDAPGGAAGS